MGIRILILASILCAGFADAQGRKLELLRVGVSNFSASYAPLIVAQKRGFYQEEGLTVEIILLAGLLGTRALVGGSVDFASASNPNAAVQGARLKMLVVFNDKPTSVLVARPGIKTVEELRGKRVGGSTVGSLEYGWLKELLPKFGLSLERDVNFLPIGPTSARFTALRAGSIDATVLSPPSSFLAEDAGFPVLTRLADHIEDIQASIVTTDQKLGQQERQVLRFLKATVKGFRHYLAHRQESITAIMEFTRQKNPELAARVFDNHMQTVARDGTIPERLQLTVIDRTKRLVDVTREVRPEEIFNFTYLRRAAAEVDASGWRP